MKRAVLLVLLLGCRSPAKPRPAPVEVVEAGPPQPQLRTPKGGMDVTFAVTSDTHIGYGDIDQENEQLKEYDWDHDAWGLPFEKSLR